MKTITFESKLLSEVINEFNDWKEENEVVVYSVRQMFDTDTPCEMTAWYEEKEMKPDGKPDRVVGLR